MQNTYRNINLNGSYKQIRPCDSVNTTALYDGGSLTEALNSKYRYRKEQVRQTAYEKNKLGPIKGPKVFI